MRKNTVCLFLFSSLLSISGMAENRKDSTQIGRNYVIDEVVVTGTRNETDIRHLPMTISIVNRQQIEKRYEPSLLPLLTEQVPGLFTTSRGIMGYGVSTGAAGGMSLCRWILLFLCGDVSGGKLKNIKQKSIDNHQIINAFYQSG